jgi:hypothetical protein
MLDAEANAEAEPVTPEVDAERYENDAGYRFFCLKHGYAPE